jgi:hypothetical protein
VGAAWRRHRALERLLERWPELEGDAPPCRSTLAALLERENVDFELAPSGPSRDYDAAVLHGRIPTREHSWHDTFNVLAFILYPVSKATLHARIHALACARERKMPRAREEDALTLIDEVSLLVAGPSDAIAAFERARPGPFSSCSAVAELDSIVREHGLFVDVLGHALLEHLMLARPEVGAGVVTIALPGELTRARVDLALAQRMVEGAFPKPGLSPTLPWPDACVDAWMVDV